MKNQERRLIEQKAVDANAFLATLFMGAQQSLQVLNGDGLPTGDELSDYLARPGPLGGPAVAIVSVRPGADGPVAAAAIGDAPAVGDLVTGERAATYQRAAATGQLATALLRDRGRTTLLLAFASRDANGAFVTSQESFLAPSTPVGSAPGSPFADLRGAFYLGTARPENLLLTTDRLPLRGMTVRSSLPVGADVYTTTIGARSALVGSLDKVIPLVLFGGGLVTAALAAAVAQVLARRRDSAMALVQERTMELAETRDFLEGILTAGPLVVARRSVSSGEIMYLSPNVERVLGHSTKAARDGFLSRLTHPDDLPTFIAALESVASGGTPHAQVESRVRMADGSYRWVSTILVGEGNDPDVRYVVEYLLDVDDRHRAEAAQRNAQRLAEEALARAEKASQHKSDFLSHMSHELRTPLNAVLGFAQLLQEEVTDDGEQEEIRQILVAGNHLLALINELLDIARIESGRLTVSLEDVDPARLVNEALELIHPLAAQRAVTIDRNLDGCSGWVLRADPQRAKQVLLNLLSNAVKYNKLGGTIAVDTRLVAPGRVALDVTDTGPGIAPEKLERIFEPFERVGAEYSGIDGAGIGLALARQLSTAMGATLTVATSLGAGSTFTVEFDASPASSPGLAVAATSTASVGDAARNRPTILYIEDDVANLKLVERLLAKHGEFRLIGAMTGSLGLQLAREHVPALILLDLNLPDIRGEEILRRLRADPATAQVPVAVLSADAMQARVDHLLAEGVVAYLTKPLVLTEVLRVVREWVVIPTAASHEVAVPRLSA